MQLALADHQSTLTALCTSIWVYLLAVEKETLGMPYRSSKLMDAYFLYFAGISSAFIFQDLFQKSRSSFKRSLHRLKNKIKILFCSGIQGFVHLFSFCIQKAWDAQQSFQLSHHPGRAQRLEPLPGIGNSHVQGVLRQDRKWTFQIFTCRWNNSLNF